MPAWLSGILKFIAIELPKALKAHPLRSILAIMTAVLIIEALFLNPMFGSTKLKAQLISVMVDDRREYASIISYLSDRDHNSPNLFEQGAAQAGYYTSRDRQLIRAWEVEAENLDWNSGDNQRTALADARARAEMRREPFQLVGRPATVSSPDCRQDRPGFGKVFLNQRRQLGRLFRPGDSVKIVDSRGGGMPVIATVEYPDRSMPDYVDLSLNKYQMEKMLGRLDMVAEVRVSTTSAPVNQDADDDRPDLVKRCKLPFVR